MLSRSHSLQAGVKGAEVTVGSHCLGVRPHLPDSPDSASDTVWAPGPSHERRKAVLACRGSGDWLQLNASLPLRPESGPAALTWKEGAHVRRRERSLAPYLEFGAVWLRLPPFDGRARPGAGRCEGVGGRTAGGSAGGTGFGRRRGLCLPCAFVLGGRPHASSAGRLRSRNVGAALSPSLPTPYLISK